jgi:hypothetical protein
MIITELFSGQGCGNQLACYVTTRCIALDRGFKFGIQHPERFKGKFFKNIDFGEVVIGGVTIVDGERPANLPDGIINYHKEISSDYDPEVFNIEDNTYLIGNLQGEKYFENHRDEIKKWLEVEPLDMPDDTCVINFRGGEYVGVPQFFLPQSYWDNAINNMKKINPNMRFEVHTDDMITARKFFPHYCIISDIEINWRSIRYAKYLILSNSTFALFPAWLGDAKLIIAPKSFERFNEEYWFLEQNFMKCFTYQDKGGNINV